MLCLRRPSAPPSPAVYGPQSLEELAQHHLLGSNFETYSAGGGGGGAWDDSILQRTVTGVQAWVQGSDLKALQFEYAGGVWGDAHGTKTGSTYYWTVPQGQTVTGVTVWVDSRVRGLKFTSSNGATSPVFGASGYTQKNFTPATSGDALLVVTGRSGNEVDQLSFTFGTPKPATDVLFSKRYGGEGGGAFLDNMNVTLPAKLTGFSAKGGSRLDSFTASYGGVAASNHGGTGGGEQTPFLVADADFVNQVKIYYGSDGVYGVQFFTKKNNSSVVFGGTNNTFEMVSGTPDKPVLAVIGGRCGATIDQLYFGFTCVTADSYIIKQITYGVPVVGDPIATALGSVHSRNLTSTDQEANLTITTNITETSSWEESNAATVGIETTVTAEAGVIFTKASMSFTMSASWTGTWTTHSEHSKSVEYSVQQTVTVPPNKKITGTLTGNLVTATVPWTGKKVPVLDGVELTEYTMDVSGTLKASTVGEYSLEWTEQNA